MTLQLQELQQALKQQARSVELMALQQARSELMALQRARSQLCPPEMAAPFQHVLHQMWLPPHNDAREVPAELKPLGERWSTVLTDRWTRRVWTSHAAIRQLWVEHFPNLLDVFDGYPNVVQQADASRLVLMSIFGGVCAHVKASNP